MRLGHPFRAEPFGYLPPVVVIAVPGHRLARLDALVVFSHGTALGEPEGTGRPHYA